MKLWVTVQAPRKLAAVAANCTACGAPCSKPALRNGICNAKLKCVPKKKSPNCGTSAPAPHVVPVTWTIPVSPNHLNLTVGDSLQIKWGGPIPHSVLSLDNTSFASCSLGSGKTLASQATAGSFTWNASAPGNFFLVCGVPGHCQAGMKLSVNVAPAAPRKLSPGMVCTPLNCPFIPVCNPPSVLQSQKNSDGCDGCPQCIPGSNCTGDSCLPCCPPVERVGQPPCRDCGLRG